MSIVSISEAAELTGKTRRTIQRHVANGKLSRTVVNGKNSGIDTSELIRVYGELVSRDNKATESHRVTLDPNTQDATNNNLRLTTLEHELSIVKIALEAEKQRVQDKQETIESLKGLVANS